CTCEVYGQRPVEMRTFNRRRDASEYFVDLLKGIPEHEIAHDAGLWTWLTLFYFDQICPIDSGARKVKNDYYYIFEPNNPRHFYRHLLFVAWRVKVLAGDFDRLYANVPLGKLDGVTTEVMKR